MEDGDCSKDAFPPKVAVIIRGVGGCGKSTEARKIMDLAEAEGLTAHVHATNERWWTHADCPHKCKCGVPVIMVDGTGLYVCQHGQHGCGSVARAGELSGSSMYLFDPSLEADVELANLTAFMRDLEKGCDVVIAENTFICEHEVYPYTFAASFAGYLTYVVDMQGVDAETADANSKRVKHVYSQIKTNRAVIEQQILEYHPVKPELLPRRCKFVECPYGKSKAHIVLAHFFTSEAFSTKLQGAGCQAKLGAPRAGASHASEAAGREPRPRAPQMQLRPTQPSETAEKRLQTAGGAEPDIPSSPVQPSPPEAAERPNSNSDAAGPSCAAAAEEEEVVCLLDSDDEEQLQNARPQPAQEIRKAPVKSDPSSAAAPAVGPITPQQPAQARPFPHNPRPSPRDPLPRAAHAPACAAGGPQQRQHVSAAANYAGRTTATATTPAPKRRRQGTTCAAGRAGGASQTPSKAVDQGRQSQQEPVQNRAAMKRQVQPQDEEGAARQPKSRQKKGSPAEAQAQAKAARRSGAGHNKQMQLPFAAKSTQQGNFVPKVSSPGQAAGERSAAEADVPLPPASTSQQHGKQRKSTLQEEGRTANSQIGAYPAPKQSGGAAHAPTEPDRDTGYSVGLNDEPAHDFYSRHRESPKTSEQKGKAPVKDDEEEKRRKEWLTAAAADEEEMCLLMEDLSGAGIKSKFDEQKVFLPDWDELT